MSDGIKFILNGYEQVVKDLPPTMTVLEFLRTRKNLKGTKEGCAEGDCGACTAVLGTLEDNKITYRAINTCIAFIPVLDGRSLITVEHLKSLAGGDLHPVQDAMVKCHASQCGFCTPGFVMSITALNQNKKNATDTEIQDALAGNLCRCTGYRPILDAARLSNKQDNPCLPDDPAILAPLQREKTFFYEANGQKFFAPVTPEDLADIYGRHPDATLLAGGTDVGLWITKAHHDLRTIIYTGNISALHEITKTEKDMTIGAAVPYAQAFEPLAVYDESFEELLRRLGSTQIRNSGTLGGNIANGSPIGDGMPPLIALGARITLRSATGIRTLALENYFLDYKKQDRKPGEFLEKIIIPAKANDVLFKTYKVSKRFDQDISAVCGGFSVRLEDGIIKEARLAYGGMAATPRRAQNAEAALNGQKWTEDTACAAMTALDRDFAPLSDMRASAAYRMSIAKNLILRFYLETTQAQPQKRVYSHGV